MPAGEALPLLGCLAPRVDLSVPQNCWLSLLLILILVIRKRANAAVFWGQ